RRGTADRQFATLKVEVNLRKEGLRIAVGVSSLAQCNHVAFLSPALYLQTPVRVSLNPQWGSFGRGDRLLLGLPHGFTAIELHMQIRATGRQSVILYGNCDRMVVGNRVGPGRQSDRRPNQDAYQREKLA